MILHAEIQTDLPKEAKNLASIAQRCAIDMGIVLSCHSQSGPSRCLRLIADAETVLESENLYRLLCQLACFCPDTRVSLLVRAAESFHPSPKAEKSGNFS